MNLVSLENLGLPYGGYGTRVDIIIGVIRKKSGFSGFMAMLMERKRLEKAMLELQKRKGRE